MQLHLQAYAFLHSFHFHLISPVSPFKMVVDANEINKEKYMLGVNRYSYYSIGIGKGIFLKIYIQIVTISSTKCVRVQALCVANLMLLAYNQKLNLALWQ